MLAVVALVLVAIALIHVLWAFGVVWPARDRTHLALSVVGQEPFPGTVLTLVVAVALGAMAWSLTHATPGWIRYAIAGVFLLRGAAGFVEPAYRPVIRGTPYEKLNRVAYSPLCLALGLGTLLGG